MLVTGGSDFHGEGVGRGRLGKVALPDDEWARFEAELEKRSHPEKA